MAHRNRWFTWVYLLKMVIFHGYVKFPEGNIIIYIPMVNKQLANLNMAQSK